MLEMSGAQATIRERKDDLYETPAIATQKLLKAESLPVVVWEPACGRGAISLELIAAGHQVYSSDLVDYGYGHSGIDFLMEHRAPSGITCIVTNPPFKLANEFVRHAMNLCPKVIMLLRLNFIESQGRSDILDSGLLSRIYAFKKRLPMMHRDGWNGNRTSNSVAFAWFVWDRDHNGPAILTRL